MISVGKHRFTNFYCKHFVFEKYVLDVANSLEYMMHACRSGRHFPAYVIKYRCIHAIYYLNCVNLANQRKLYTKLKCLPCPNVLFIFRFENAEEIANRETEVDLKCKEIMS